VLLIGKVSFLFFTGADRINSLLLGIIGSLPQSSLTARLPVHSEHYMGGLHIMTFCLTGANFGGKRSIDYNCYNEILQYDDWDMAEDGAFIS